MTAWRPLETDRGSSRTALTALPLLCAALAVACAPVLPAVPTPSPIDTVAMRADTRVLAHDSLGGRGTGTSGARAAARYIADRLAGVGARPLDGATGTGADAFLDPVHLQRADVSGATLAVAGEAPRPHGSGFVVGRVGRGGLEAVDAPVAILGADSTAVVAGAWLMIGSSPGEAAMRWIPEWQERGVAGIVIRLASDAAVSGYHAQLGDVRWQLRDGPPDPVWQPGLPIVMVGPAVAARLAGGDARLAFAPNARLDTVTDYNVVGVLSGEANEGRDFVVLTAHYDHLGTVPGLRGDSIYNGFSDNAAGVAMLLAIARSSARAQPERPLMFLFAAAEEVGLLGSIDFVRRHPDVVSRTHAVLNIDAGAPPAPPTRWRLAAGTRSWAGAVAAAVVERHGWTHRSDPGSPNSDHWPFVARGVPAVFLIPDGGYDGLDAEATRLLIERWDRYHRPDDEWDADFPFGGLERYASLGRDIAHALAGAATDVR